ncbi:MAG: hypothetical protein EBV92_06425 [Betaproteobacteria bacterium]|nr:hypothetical protein [Betaproteobacteria bacterium]
MFASWLDHPVVYSFTRSRLAQSAGLIALVMVLGAVFAPWLAPSNPFDLASLDLNDALLPPAWQEQGSWKYWLGTDDQGRDVFSTILYGSRISLLVGVSSVLLAMF